ncbi:MAG: TctA family transporter [Candidatus Azotimanducaceae bacterium]|jgi:TctA family transporter
MAMSAGPDAFTGSRYRRGRTGNTPDVASQRDLKLKPNQLVWLVAIIVVGVIVGIALGVLWGFGAAVVTLAASEATERISRSRRNSP